MPDANAQAPQDVANMAAAQPAAAPTIVNPVDSFFDDYKTAVEADKARRPRARPRAPLAAPAKSAKAAAAYNSEDGVSPGPYSGTAYERQQSALARRQDAGMPEAKKESGWASRLSGEFGEAQRPVATSAAPHVEAFSKAVAPSAPVQLPSFVKAEKKPMNPRLNDRLASFDGARLEAMGQEFASTYAKEGDGSGYKDDDLQQVYLGVQEHLRDRVKKGYKLKTMDEARLFEED